MPIRLGFSPEFRALYAALADTVVDAFKFQQPLLNGLVRVLFAVPTLQIVRLGETYEQTLAADGHNQNAARWLLSVYASAVHQHNADLAPATGPLLVVCNHAGMGDAALVFATLPRTDVYTVVLKRGILNGLRQFNNYIIIVDENNRSAALRAMIRRLRAGQTVLLFPRGQIEEDPGLDLPGALASLPDWSASIELVARQVPDLTVQPVAVGGLISRKALSTPICRAYRTPANRNFLAATFQLMFKSFNDPHVSIAYAPPLRGDAITLPNVQAAMTELLTAIAAEQAALVEQGQLRRLP